MQRPTENPGVPDDRSSSAGWNPEVPDDRSLLSESRFGVPGDGSSSAGWKSGDSGKRSGLSGWDPESNPAPAAAASGFANLLAALAAPKMQKTGQESDWTQDDSSDDAASLSYERALRANACYKRIEWPAALIEEAEIADQARADRIRHRAADESGVDKPCSEGLKTAAKKHLKSASITIRLSHEECGQLKKRAAEAGLSISAYLRSCTFEAEALRAQVKEALAELRGAALRGNRPAEFLPAPLAPHRWWRLWQHSGARRTQA